MRMRVREVRTNEWKELQDLYWFEEEGIRTIENGVGVGSLGDHWELEIRMSEDEPWRGIKSFGQ